MASMKTIIVSATQYSRQQRKLIEYAYSRLISMPLYNKSKHISLLTINKDIVEYGINDEKGKYTHRFGYRTNHSEYETIRRFLRFNTLNDLEPLSLWNFRINRFNQVVNSKPCSKCMCMLQYFTVKHLYYTGETGEFIKLF